MVTICEIGRDGFWTGRHLDVTERDGCPPGWVWAEVPQPPAGEVARWQGAWVYVPADEAELVQLAGWKVDKIAALAAKRYAVETAGLDVAGSRISTDRDSQAMINGAFTRAKDKQELGLDGDLIQFKGLSGWVELDIPTILAIGRAVGDFVQACFAREGTLAALVEAAESQADLDAIDIGAGWPA